MSTTDQARPARVDYDFSACANDDGADHDRAWLHTTFPTLQLNVSTSWLPVRERMVARTEIWHAHIGSPPLYRIDYDPTRVTVGGLAEAHEAVCARVERGELP